MAVLTEKDGDGSHSHPLPASATSTTTVASSPCESVQIPVAEAEDGTLPSNEKDKELNLHAVSTSTSSTRTENVDQGKTSVPTRSAGKWYRKLNPLRLRRPPPIPTERSSSREYSAGFFSIITFQWMSPLMMTGYLRPLEMQDIWLVNPDRSIDVLVSKLESSFKRRVERGDRHPLVLAIYETFKWEFWVGGICQLFASLLQVFTPYTTRYLIAFATDAYFAKFDHQPGPPVGHGIGIAVGIACMQVLQSLGTSQFFFRGMMVGGQVRAALISMIFVKTTKLSGRAKAGGKAIDTEQQNGGITTDAEDQEHLRTARDEILGEINDNKTSKHKKKKGGRADRGQKLTPDLAAGISGDGSGWSNGKILTLMSVDTDRIDTAMGMFHLLWTSPILVVVTLVLLVVNIGYSALSGYALLVLGVPLLTYSIRSLIRRRRSINKVTDQRVSLTQEILQAVRFVKFFGWESSFLERLNDLRRREIKAIQFVLAIRNAILCVSMSLPVFASMLSFVTYSLSRHDLNPARVFSSLALFNALRLPLNMLPLVIGQVTDAWTAIGRVQEFFLAEEQKDDIKWNKALDNAVEVGNASFTWERLATDPDAEDGVGSKKSHKAKRKATEKKDEQQQPQQQRQLSDPNPSSDVDSGAQTPIVEEPFKLTDLTFTAGRNELLAVIGTVGCGKSSLLAALAGDMRLTTGHITMGTSRAFCPQYAWIQNATVKDNILFGKEYDYEWYNQVVDACALRADFEMLPAGDRTEIGERGITVSGGQKQRLNIARAIYFDADLILMDDPLSAVDAHVGRHIMDHAICGLLKDKCRILATHQLHVLNRCDRIILMNEGRIVAVDSFDNLMRDNDMFQRLMASTSQEEEEQKESKDEGGDEDGIESHVEEEIEEKEQKPRHSKTTKGRSRNKTPAALMQQEERAVSSVSWSVWGAYVAAFGHAIYLPLVVIALLLTNGGNIMTSLWLTFWTSDKYDLAVGQYIGIYAGLAFLQVVLMFIFTTVLSTSGTNASKTMFLRAMTRVLRAPLAFFDTTPLGRITNRFSKDVHTMDNELTDAMRIYYITFTMIISVVVLIIVFYHYFAVALVPLLILFLLATNFYRASARELKRHESVLRSVVFARFGEAITGTSTIRAYGLQRHFTRRLHDAIDNMDSAYFLTFSNQRWLSVRLDAVGILMVLVLGILVVTSRFSVSPSICGLVLSYILAIVQMLQFTVRQLAEVENNMNATERIHYYGTELEEEAPLHTIDVDPTWPQKGNIKFSDVQMRYRAGLPFVLQGLNMEISGGERIGIVGRTGAGKSSIMSALFRLTELSGGSISIDGIDISKIGLFDLRSRLAIIPQDPALFRGTVRSNLDPFNEHTDLELWAALRKAGLVGEDAPDSHPANTDPTSITTSVTGGNIVPDPNSSEQIQEHSQHQQQQRIHLDTGVEEEGLNFSLGQRQLMALARALVRDSRIIVCDEATSSVDFETDAKIQRTMAQGFKGKTLLCIAHRLRTIVNYDRICVMDQGRIAELDAPLNLWEKGSGGIFRSMCDRSGISREDILSDQFAT